MKVLVVYVWDAFKQAVEILHIQYGVSTYKISSTIYRMYDYFKQWHATDGFFNIMTYGDNADSPFQHFLWYNDTLSSCLSGNRNIQNEWPYLDCLIASQVGRFSPIASVITGFVLLIVCLILFIPLSCLIIIMFNNKRKFRRLRRRIEAFLTSCFYQKIVDEKFIAEDYKLLMHKLKANRPEISVAGKRVPSRRTKLLPVDDTTKKPDILATAVFWRFREVSDPDCRTTVHENCKPIMHESGIHKTGQPLQLADEVSVTDYDSGASKPQTPNSTTASTAPSEVKKPTTSVDKKIKEQKPEKDGKKESKDTKKRKKMYPFDLSDTQKQ
ncbi:hypothetical protein M3Y95_00086200 [Aphelenchoides besseyi]|nr:hypothetical protein M3Y95_00086200 [Aphelenchoides besseyi]